MSTVGTGRSRTATWTEVPTWDDVLSGPRVVAPATTRGGAGDTLAAIVDSLDPVGLPELAETAGLLTRVDRKYLLTETQAAAVLAGLPTRTRALQIGELRSFGYESVYLDTPDLVSYLAAAHRRRRRFKVRLRTYCDTGEEWLEVKTRATRGRTVKDRLPDPRGTHGTRRFVATSLAEGGVHGVDLGALHPRLTVWYRRRTLLLPDGARGTIDTELRWLDGPLRRAAGPVVVMETKTPGGASLLDRALWRAGHRPARISKYATGLALLYSSLPSGRWHRTLTMLEAL